MRNFALLLATVTVACSAGVLLERVSVTTLRPPSVRRWGMGEGKSEIFFAPPLPLSFLLPIVHPLGRTFFLSPVFHCLKNSRWKQNFLRCERLHEKISPALQATVTAAFHLLVPARRLPLRRKHCKCSLKNCEIFKPFSPISFLSQILFEGFATVIDDTFARSWKGIVRPRYKRTRLTGRHLKWCVHKM